MVCNVFEVIKKNSRKLFFQHAIHESVPFGVILAIVGGFLDAYTFIERGGVFANAQTANIVLLGVYASEGNCSHALVHVPPILAFIIGVIVAESIKTHSLGLFTLDWKRRILIFEIIILFIIGFMPHTSPNIVVTVAVSFVASIQSCSFRKLVDSPYATTISTGNLRTASQAAYIALTKKDCESAIRAIRYFTIIVSFIFGGFLGGLLSVIIGVKAIWVAGIILVYAAILISIDEKKQV